MSHAPSSGFSLVEAIVALALTAVVLGAVFALLSRGVRTPTVETEKAALHAQARSALERISRDVLEAGANLPPEFPAFVPPEVNPELQNPARLSPIEIVGRSSNEDALGEPEAVKGFDRGTVELEAPATRIRVGDLVLVYDDAGPDGSWVFGLVDEVRSGPPPILLLKTASGEAVGETTLPSYIGNYNRGYPAKGFVTPVDVVDYFVMRDPTPTAGNLPSTRGAQVLMRQVNWGAPRAVASVENLQLRYVLGDVTPLVPDPSFLIGPPQVPPPVPISPLADDGASPLTRPPGDVDVEPPPITTPSDAWPYTPSPQSPPSFPSQRSYAATNRPDGEELPPLPVVHRKVVVSVVISVTSRSQAPNLEGSTKRPGEDEGYLRFTLSSQVMVRNGISRLSARGQASYN